MSVRPTPTCTSCWPTLPPSICPEGLLIYAQGEEEPVVHEVRHSGKRLEVAALDLSGSLEQALDRVGGLAGKVRALRDEARGVARAA